MGAFKNATDNKTIILAYGNTIEGTVAAVKRLIDARNTLFFSDANQTVSVIDTLDLSGISVHDVLKNSENNPYYNANSQDFRRVVEKVLNNNQFDIDIKTVKTYNDNTTLRLKHVNADYSNEYKDAVVNGARPVVIAPGLWGDLTGWQDFGQELATNEDKARDVWLIEIHSGADNLECDSCPAYSYNDQVDYFWPALISGVLQYSNQSATQYVGHSHGALVGLDALGRYDSAGKSNAGYYFNQSDGVWILRNLPANAVDTYVGFETLGKFNGTSPGKETFAAAMDTTYNYFKNRLGVNHPTGDQFNIIFTTFCLVDPQVTGILAKAACYQRFMTTISNTGGNSLTSDGGKMSIEIFDHYYNITSSESDQQPGINLQIDNFALLYGKYRLTSLGSYDDNDGLVTVKDQQNIYNNVTSTNKKLFGFNARHSDLDNSGQPSRIIAYKFLNNIPLTSQEEEDYLKASNN